MSRIPCQHPQIEALRQQLAQWEGGAVWRQALEDPASLERVAALSSGCPALDRALPQKGFRPGTLVEWLSRGEGDGTATLVFHAAAGALHSAAGAFHGAGGAFHSGGSSDGSGKAVVVLDRTGEFYPPAAVALGIEPSRLIVVHPGNKADHIWALDQALRSVAVAAVVAWPESLDGKLDGRTFRRLQLAVEQGGGLGLLIRPESVRGQPSWADVRLLVEPLASSSPDGRRMRVVILRCRGGGHHVRMVGEQSVTITLGDGEIDDETHSLHQD